MSSWIRRISRLLPQSVNLFPCCAGLAAARRYCRLAPLALLLATAGCGGGGSSSSSTAPAGLQPPASAGPFNTYIGTSPNDGSASGASTVEAYAGYGLWSVSFDHTPSACPAVTGPQPLGCFNAVDVTTDATNSTALANVTGTFLNSGGFLNLTAGADGSSAGFALELPDRVSVLRQGDNTMPVTAMVPTGCPSINGNKKFNFVVLPTISSTTQGYVIWDVIGDAAYGSLQIANSGTTWNLTSYQLSTLGGAAAPLSGTVLPAGTCVPTAAGTAVWVPSDPAQPLPKTVAVGPSGFYIADQGLASDLNGYPGEFGVVQPSAALNATDILSPKNNYLGFIYEAGAFTTSGSFVPVPAESQLAAFASTTAAGLAGSCTSTTCSGSACTTTPQPACLVGGGFPLNSNTGIDDPTQPAALNLVISLGEEDPTNYGVYPNAQITNANGFTVCADGITTPCPYPAVAVVGNQEGKYSIFIIGEDEDNLLPFGIYLFQQ